ncbi:MAG: class II aldolase/adducin family protein [bacterium]
MDPRAALVRAAHRLREMECLPASDGNLSARSGPSLFWISPSGVEKGRIAADDFVLLDASGQTIEGRGKPSSEWPMHWAIYCQRNEVNSILHAHPPFLTAFAAAHRVPDLAILAEAHLAIGEIHLVPYAAPGSASLGREIVAKSTRAGIYMLENHGAVAVGREVDEALHRLERAEFLARVSLLTEKIGGAVPLSEAEVVRLRQRRQGEI